MSAAFVDAMRLFSYLLLLKKVIGELLFFLGIVREVRVRYKEGEVVEVEIKK